MQKPLKIGVVFILFILPNCASKKNDNKIGLEVGNIAPELAYPNPQGKVLKLSDLRGKLVLIDFWASWCPPCRKENPYIVQVYNKYQNKEFKNANGFTIFSVSFDRTKEEWVAAIEKDSLRWKYHVSDLNGWNGEAGFTYKVSYIPYNVLIDAEGAIIEWNLKHGALEQKLDSLLKK